MNIPSMLGPVATADAIRRGAHLVIWQFDATRGSWSTVSIEGERRTLLTDSVEFDVDSFLVEEE